MKRFIIATITTMITGLGLTAWASATRTSVSDFIQSSDTTKTYQIVPKVIPISTSDIDWSAATSLSCNLYTKTLSANTTFTFSNQTAGQEIKVQVTNTTGNYSLSWPANTIGPSGLLPTQTTGNHTDLYTLVYDGTTTRLRADQAYSSTSGFLSGPSVTGSGNTVNTVGNYKYVVFVSSGTLSFSGGIGSIATLVVGGGAGGGFNQGGGGGGAFPVYTTPGSSYTSGTTINVTIGSGGTGATAGTSANNPNTLNGSSSFWDTGGVNIEGSGGGGGASGSYATGATGGTGNSDGGGGAYTSGSGGAGVGAGFAGGNGGGAPNYTGAGGGGAGATGQNGNSAGNAGNGGAGVAYQVTSSGLVTGGSTFYGGGGGGGGGYLGLSTGGSGGSGGGGAGGLTSNHNGTDGTANTGGGGGGDADETGAAFHGGSGGSGTVIAVWQFQ